MPEHKADELVERLSGARRRWLRTHGLLLLRVPLERGPVDGHFRWHREVPLDDPELEDAVWYFDGSMIFGQWADLRCTGFGVVVVGPSGSLLAYGSGTPPAWCSTAAAAEAWALLEVLTARPFPPSMRTDCHALLDTLAAGVEAATAPSRPLARLWVRVAHALDGSFGELQQSGRLVWMPAHCTVAAVGMARLSNGSRLSVIDWRANRLADALAQAAARSRLALGATVGLLAAATSAVRHAARLLGQVTHASNHHEVVLVEADGASRVVVRRDAVQTPCRRATRGTAERAGRGVGGGAAQGMRAACAGGGLTTTATGWATGASCHSTPRPFPVVPGVFPVGAPPADPVRSAAEELVGPTPLPPPLARRAASAGQEVRGRTAGERRAAATRLHLARTRALEEELLRRRVADAARGAVTPTGAASAGARMAALRGRLAARSRGL